MALPIGIAVASILLLHRIRTEEWLPPPREILDAPPEQALYGVVWMLALTVTAWIALTTLVSVVAYSTRTAMAIRAVEWVALPPVRRLGKRWAGLLLAAGSMTMAGPAGATIVAPIPLVVGSHQPAAATPDTAVVSPDSTEKVSVPAAVPLGAAGIRTEWAFRYDRAATSIPPFLRAESSDPFTDGPADSIVYPDTIVYTVRPGDSLWSIAAAHIAQEGEGPPSPTQIVPLWQQVIALNQERLRSTDPDLIFPGEEILLPPLDDYSVAYR